MRRPGSVERFDDGLVRFGHCVDRLVGELDHPLHVAQRPTGIRARALVACIRATGGVAALDGFPHLAKIDGAREAPVADSQQLPVPLERHPDFELDFRSHHPATRQKAGARRWECSREEE